MDRNEKIHKRKYKQYKYLNTNTQIYDDCYEYDDDHNVEKYYDNYNCANDDDTISDTIRRG